MMKLVFIENRYKTYFWDSLAHFLEQKGCKIAWLIQNPAFMPSTGRVHVIGFPKKFELTTKVAGPSDLEVETSDRTINYFGGSNSHYGYYRREICGWLEKERPDFVIGESTLFHELMAIQWCKEHGVIYLHPSMPGYPNGRFILYLGNTKEYLNNLSEDTLSDLACLEYANGLKKRHFTPDYMRMSSSGIRERKYPMPGEFADRKIILQSFLRGEHFNTPSPWKKFWLDIGVKDKLRRWKKISAWKDGVVAGSRVLLYPLQMQPEANLDVWGRDYRDQVALVKQILDNLPDNWIVLVKANPKPKYELSDELLSFLEMNSRVIPVPLEREMGQVLDGVDLVCTVTGTIAVECVLAQKPVIQLGPGIVRDGEGCNQLRRVGDVATVVSNVERGRYRYADDATRINLVKRLYRSTANGIVSDPATFPEVLGESNINIVGGKLLSVFKQLSMMPD